MYFFISASLDGDFILEWSFHPSSRFSGAFEDVPNVHTYTLFNKTFITMEDEIFMATLNKSLKMESVGNLDHTNTIYLQVSSYLSNYYSYFPICILNR